jgi:glutamate-1-semialdehyde 2,1-aminomutase
MNSEQLFEKSLQFVPGGVHSPVRSFKGLHTTPRFVKSAKGAYITDVDGKDYIDFCMSFGPMILGHQNPQVREAINTALDNGWTYGACEPYSLELAEFLMNKLPFDQIRFVNSGTEAVMTAVRLAKGYTGKSKILKFTGCYHGHLDALLIKAGSGLAGTTASSSAGVGEDIIENTLTCELNDKEAVEAIFKEHGDDIALVALEPLPANSGILEQDLEYLQFLRDITKKHNSLLLFDEVISGFRVGFGGMVEKTDIIPDMVCYGKIIGGGMPVGAVSAKSEIMSKLAPLGDVYQAGTLSANPVAMAAGLATLKQLTPDLYQSLETNTQKITALFQKWFDENGFEDYSIVQKASLFWQLPTKERVTQASKIPHNLGERFYKLFEILLNKGIYFSPNGYEIGFVSAAHNDEVIADLEKRLWS